MMMVGFFSSEVLGSFGLFLWLKLLKHSCYPQAFFVILYLCHVDFCPYRFPTIILKGRNTYHTMKFEVCEKPAMLNKVAHPACPTLSFSSFPPFSGSKGSQTPFNVVYKISMQLNSREMFWTKINICMFLLQCGTVF